jgi:transposase
VRTLERDSLLVERVERLMTIPAVGPITALTWALEIGDVQRFSSIKKAISYFGLGGAEKSSTNIAMRTPFYSGASGLTIEAIQSRIFGKRNPVFSMASVINLWPAKGSISKK